MTPPKTDLSLLAAPALKSAGAWKDRDLRARYLALYAQYYAGLKPLSFRSAHHGDICYGNSNHFEVGRGYQRCRLCGFVRL